MDNVSQDLILKVQEKLSGLLDLITFENGEKLVQYLGRYLILTRVLSALICLVVVIAFFCLARYSLKKMNEDDTWFMGVAIGYGVSGITFIFTLVYIYSAIIAANFPVIAIIEWLNSK